MNLSEAENLHKKIMEMSVEDFDSWYEKLLAEHIGDYADGYSAGYSDGYNDGAYENE